MSLMAGTTCPTKLGGIFALSSYLLLQSKLQDLVPKDNPNKVGQTRLLRNSADTTFRIHRSSWATVTVIRSYNTSGVSARQRNSSNGDGLSTSTLTEVFLIRRPLKSSMTSRNISSRGYLTRASQGLCDCLNKTLWLIKALYYQTYE